MAVGDKIETFHKALKELREAAKEVAKVEARTSDIPTDYKTVVNKLHYASEKIYDDYGSMVDEWRTDYMNRRS